LERLYEAFNFLYLSFKVLEISSWPPKKNKK
jgi:hypothetical protein